MILEEGGGGWELYAGVAEGSTGGSLVGLDKTSTPTQEKPERCVHEYLAVLGGLQLPAWTKLGYEAPPQI